MEEELVRKEKHLLSQEELRKKPHQSLERVDLTLPTLGHVLRRIAAVHLGTYPQHSEAYAMPQSQSPQVPAGDVGSLAQTSTAQVRSSRQIPENARLARSDLRQEMGIGGALLEKLPSEP